MPCREMGRLRQERRRRQQVAAADAFDHAAAAGRRFGTGRPMEYGLPPAYRHAVSKGGAVNRFADRPGGCAKNVAMLAYSLASVCGQWPQNQTADYIDHTPAG